ncbi:MAG: hypothetical protein MJ009_02910 [Paludibacteraceae bacterium]|nr:hypothetical protein [Paludibacteraceae bacterium]
MKKNALRATLIAIVAMFAGSVYAADATHSACVSTSESPSIGSPITGSTYKWGIEGGTSGTDWTLSTDEGTSTTIEWLNAGTFTLWSQETNEHSCIGPKMEIEVTVSSFTTNNLSNGICSTSQATGSAVDVVSVNLPTEASCGGSKLSSSIDKWVITSIDNLDKVTAGAGNATVGAELTDAGAIANDSYTNASDTEVVLTYNITPYIGALAGSPFTVTVTVYPEVKKPTINW